MKLRKISLTLSAFLLPALVLAAGFDNPLKANTLEGILSLIIDSAIILLMPIVILMVIYSGFMFLMARGNEQKLKTAKTNFVWVVIGLVVLLGAKIISAALQSTAETIIK